MKQLLLLILYSLINTSVVFSQTADANNVDTLAGNFIKHLQHNNREKIFVQTDKWFYTAGETIWLKAYCINAFSHKYSAVSKIMFADLVNDKDSVIQTVILNIPLHKTDAAIQLPASISEGYYWLRAYTKKMLQDDKNSISVQPVYVVTNNAPLKLPKEEIINNQTDNTSIPELTFFPEGGSIISGTTNTIGFRAATKSGKPVIVTGYVTDNMDTVVARFKTDFAGMGKFDLSAWKVRKYTAHISWNDKKDIKYPLPLIDPFAIQLSVPDQNNNSIHIVVSMGDSLYKKNKQTYLVAVNRDHLLFASVGRDMYELNIPVANFPGGKTQLMLFNDQQQVVSERSVFVNNKPITLNAVADKVNYNRREKATLNIIAGDSINHPAASLLSVAVTDDNQVHETIDTRLIKTLLQDNIDLPADTMLVDNYNTGEQDLIMLTQKPAYTGWKIKQEINNLQKQDAVLENDSNITGVGGQIVNAKNEPDANQVVTLIANGKIDMIDRDTTDARGRFYFNLPPNTGNVEFTLQVTDEKNRIKDEKILQDLVDLPAFSTPVALKKKFNAEEAALINHYKINHPDIYISKGKEYLSEVKVTGFSNNKGIDPKRRMSPNSHLIVFGERERDSPQSTRDLVLSSPGVSMRQGLLTLQGGPTDMKEPGSKDEPLIVIDGLPYTNTVSSPSESSPALAFLSSIATNTIDFIEVLSGPDGAQYGIRGAHGAIIVNTLSDARPKDSPGAVGKLKSIHKGYSVPATFESPDYSKKEFKKSTSDDLRSTIFWNSNIYTGKDGKASLSFYTADAAATYTATIMGISSEGTIIYKKIRLSRK
jgi:TonB-dependent Receptor Plug Domain